MQLGYGGKQEAPGTSGDVAQPGYISIGTFQAGTGNFVPDYSSQGTGYFAPTMQQAQAEGAINNYGYAQAQQDRTILNQMYGKPSITPMLIIAGLVMVAALSGGKK